MLKPGFVRHTEQMGLATVLVVEDDTFARTLITTSLASHMIDVVAATAHASRAVLEARKGLVDVALLDLDLGPGPTGFELAVVLRREWPTMGIVFLTSYRDPRLLLGTMDQVPVGSRFIQKSELTDVKALVNVVLQAKGSPCAPQAPRVSGEPILTKNQLKVLRMVAAGRSTNEIADELGVSSKAVEASIARVNRILDVSPDKAGNTRVSLVRAFYAITGRTPPRV
jgi:DNA-binding NarL/FixJ family response regulator